MIIRIPLLAFFLFSLSTLLRADPAPSSLSVPHVFGDHMVLQTGEPVPVWGWDKAGQPVTVTFAGQSKQATAAGDGAWRVTLDPLAISAQPADLVIAGSQNTTFHDVLVGEVWLCSGQSNMQKPVGTWRGQPVPTDNYQQELAAANYPLIRLMNEEISNAPAPARDLVITTRPKADYPWLGWVACTPASLDQIKFSAVGYFFARKLYQELNVPIGMIEATAGGTHIEGWTPASGFALDPALADFAKAAQNPKVKYEGTIISTLYNGMIHPLIPFAIRGILWYQGESNLIKGDGPIYTNKMAALIKSWRADWGQELPFYYVQLPPLLYSARKNPSHTSSDEAVFRDAQTAALALPKTGMVVTTDLGELKNMHPPHKKRVGERLALWALARDYGRKGVEPSGPQYRPGSIEHEGYKAVLHYTHVGKGLASSDGKPLTWFTTAGADGKFYPANAAISGDAVVITSPQVPEPKDVRFAWDEAAMPNFYNKDGLPGVPFRTDNYPPPVPAATPVPSASPSPAP